MTTDEVFAKTEFDEPPSVMKGAPPPLSCAIFFNQDRET